MTRTSSIFCNEEGNNQGFSTVPYFEHLNKQLNVTYYTGTHQHADPTLYLLTTSKSVLILKELSKKTNRGFHMGSRVVSLF